MLCVERACLFVFLPDLESDDTAFSIIRHALKRLQERLANARFPNLIADKKIADQKRLRIRMEFKALSEGGKTDDLSVVFYDKRFKPTGLTEGQFLNDLCRQLGIWIINVFSEFSGEFNDLRNIFPGYSPNNHAIGSPLVS